MLVHIGLKSSSKFMKTRMPELWHNFIATKISLYQSSNHNPIYQANLFGLIVLSNKHNQLNFHPLS
jgi:hypothetical protein